MRPPTVPRGRPASAPPPCARSGTPRPRGGCQGSGGGGALSWRRSAAAERSGMVSAARTGAPGPVPSLRVRPPRRSPFTSPVPPQPASVPARPGRGPSQPRSRYRRRARSTAVDELLFGESRVRGPGYRRAPPAARPLCIGQCHGGVGVAGTSPGQSRPHSARGTVVLGSCPGSSARLGHSPGRERSVLQPLAPHLPALIPPCSPRLARQRLFSTKLPPRSLFSKPPG